MCAIWSSARTGHCTSSPAVAARSPDCIESRGQIRQPCQRQPLLRQVSQSHPEAVAPFTAEALPAARVARAQRRRLESLHNGQGPDAVDEVWPFLDSDDRWLRFAARRALERLKLSHWRVKALQETRPTAATQAILALCRCATAADQADVLAALERIAGYELKPTEWLALLRGYQLCFLRLGPPDAAAMATVRERLGSHYPDTSASANHLLCELLVYLGDETVVDKTLTLLAGNDLTQEEQVRAVETLWHARVGWTPERRREMLRWLPRVDAFVVPHKLLEWRDHIKEDFVATLSADERQAYADEIAALTITATEHELPTVMNRPLVKDWCMADLESRLGERSTPAARMKTAAEPCWQRTVCNATVSEMPEAKSAPI